MIEERKYEHAGSLIPKLAVPFAPFDSVLDVGGGPGILGHDFWINDFNVPSTKFTVIDIWQQSCGVNFVLGDALDAVKLVGPKSFDVVIAADLIEHMHRERGLRLFTVLEAVARKFIAFQTPSGYLAQVDEAELKNPYQRHLSGWDPEDFTSRGYNVILNGGASVGDQGYAQIIAWKRP